MKKSLFIMSLFGGIFSFGQSNYQHSLEEKQAFHSFNHTTEALLETDYVPEYYRLEINSDPEEFEFSGMTTMHFTTTAETNQIKINAQQNLDITSVSYHSSPITNYSRQNDVLTITLPGTLDNNQLDSISIGFSGSAMSSNGYSIGTHNGHRVSYTLSESFQASTWWVCKDDLLDKVDKLDVYITHPSNLKAASNGKLMSVTNLGNGNSRTHWQHNYPIPTYLIAVAVTNYTEYNNSVNISGTDVPIINYIYPESLSEAQNTLDLTPTYISEISEKYGDYPYKLEKYGHAEWEWGGGMEHATMSFVGGWNRGLIKHELAHQWFGDKVTCGTWSDIWLNEGFAEYTDGWLVQLLDGENDFKDWKEDYVWYITDAPWGSVYNPEPNNEDRIFDYRLTYAKGSMMVHLIRYIINNDDLFYQALRNYLDDPAHTYGFGTTDEFHASLEASTGMDWDNFFEDWIYGEGHPIFSIAVNNYAADTGLSVRVNQNQSNSSVDFFETPFEIEFHGTGNQTATRRFNLTQNGQIFQVTDIPFEVTSYVFNPNFDVVCRVNSTTLDNKEINGTESSKARIYPNPAQDFFTIENKQNIDEIKVFDATGKIVYNQNNFNQNKVQINSNSWPSGVYMVQVKSGERTQLMKVLVK